MAQKYYGEPGHLIALGVWMILLDVLFVGLRFWTRRRQSEKWLVDDWLLVPATILIIGMAALVIWSVSNKYIAYPLDIPENITMKDFGVLSTEKMVFASKLDYYFLIFLCPCLGLIKTSFLFFFKRVFAREHSSAWNYALNAAIAFTVLWTLVFFGVHLFECGTHFQAIWGDAESYLKYCIRIPYLVFAFCLTDLLTSIAITLIPIPLIWGSDMTTRKKVAAIGVFGLGVVALAASITRLCMSVKATGFTFNGSKSQDLPGDDVVLTVALHLYWALVECGIGIIVACLPALAFFTRPLLLLVTGQFKYAYHSAFVSGSGSPSVRTATRSTKSTTTRRSEKRSEKRSYALDSQGQSTINSSSTEDTYVASEKEVEIGMCEKWIEVQLDKFMEVNGGHNVDPSITDLDAGPNPATRPTSPMTRAGSQEFLHPPEEAHTAGRRESKFQEIWWRTM